jgi:hypothetical protein
MKWIEDPDGQKPCALRDQTLEPAFGTFKLAIAHRQFLMRGLNSNQGEWDSIAMI